MKTLYIVLISLLLAPVFVQGQVDRTRQPEPGPPPKAAFPDFYETKLDNGLKVFVVENHEEPLVTFRILFKTGAEYDGEQSGLADIMCTLLTKGTRNRSALEFAKEADFIGANIGAGASDDKMFLTGSGLKKHMDKILDLMTDALYNPVFPEDELEKTRKRELSGLAMQKKNPSALAGKLKGMVVYNRHPYALNPTETSLKSITRDDILSRYRAHFVPGNASLAVVGDVTPEEIMPVIKRYFGTWKGGTPPAGTFPEPEPLKGKTVHLVDRGPSAVQSTIMVTGMGMKRNNPDYQAFTLMNSILGGGFSGRLFQNLREKHGFTYGAYSYMDARKMAGSWSASADVRRAATDSAVTQFLYEIERMKNEPVSEEELNMHKQYISGQFLLSMESANTTASRVQQIDLYGLPKDYYKTFVQKINAMSAEQLRETARKWLPDKNIAFVVVGDAAKIKDKLEAFGPVTVYDTDLRPVKETAPSDLTAGQLVEKMIEATGGRKAMEAITDRTMTGDVTIDMGGRTFKGSMLEISKAPNKQYRMLDLGVMKQETYVDGERAVQIMGGNVQELQGKQRDDLLLEAQFNEILRLDELKIKPEARGRKEFKGTDCYVLTLNKPNGSTFTYYLDANTFLPIGAESVMETQRGPITQEMEMSDYRKVDGVMMPHKITLSGVGPQIKFVITSIEHNTGVKDDVFVKEVKAKK